ncbi:MAG: type IX secretion system sortase PorU [Bacteroidetes bacterium]|nr:type IX secretion system sortase PorU [Bacteroidota bacterium]
MKFLKPIILLLFFFKAGAQTTGSLEGQWYRFGVKNTAVYTLDLNFLKNYVKDVKKVNPQKIRVFSAGPFQLPQPNSSNRSATLNELPVWTNDTDGRFDSKDFIKFLGVSTHQVGRNSEGKFYHQINPYSDSSFYYINISNFDSKKIVSLQPQPGTATSGMLYFEYEENEYKNLLNSGREWLGDFFYSKFTKKFKALDKISDINIRLDIMGIGRADQDLNIAINNKNLISTTLPLSYFNPVDAYARYNRYANLKSLHFISEEDESEIELSVSTPNSASAGAYIDSWEFWYERQLRFSKNINSIFWPKNISQKQYNIRDAGPSTKVWQLDSLFYPEELLISSTGDFSMVSPDIHSKILLFDSEHSIYPNFSGIPDASLNLNSKKPQMLVIFPEKFRTEAQKLIEFKKDSQHLEVLGLSTLEVYDRFSGGKTDPTAIRDLCRFFWKKDNKTLKFLLLIGDATFDYKNNIKADYLNTRLMVPTYQSRESFEPIYSYSSDDYFGFLEDHEGEWPEGKSKDNIWYSTESEDHDLDISIGRLPAKSQLEAKNIISKIINYSKFDPKAKWQNEITFVADNRDYNIHQQDAENLSELLVKQSKLTKINKIYLDSYVIESLETNPTAPKATQMLNNSLDRGSFVINYNGHGSEEGWAQEKLLTLADILNWRNQKLPIFFTATCQFGKFDNPATVSGAELSLLNPSGGAIALLTTTRPVYSSTNEKINSAFYRNFNKASTLGEWFRLTKNESIEGELNRNFSLLGDPSLPILAFENQLKISSFNRTHNFQKVITPLKNFKIEGESKNIKNGKVLITIFDKPQNISTKGTYSDGPAFKYKSEFEKIYEGIVNIKDWQFETEIMLPSAQIEGIGKGKIHLFGIDADSSIIERGYYDDFTISSEHSDILQDASPPDITLVSKSNQALNIEIFDLNGIVISNINTETAPLIIIDDTLEVDFDKHSVFSDKNQMLQVNIPTTYLASGKHKIRVKVADFNNNIAQKTFDFETVKPKLEITGYLGYPNPFSSYTNLVFQHNRPGENLEATIKVFDLYGRIVAEIQNTCTLCPEKIEFGLDFESKKHIGNQFLFKTWLRSNTDNTAAEANGRLIFWK